MFLLCSSRRCASSRLQSWPKYDVTLMTGVAYMPGHHWQKRLMWCYPYWHACSSRVHMLSRWDSSSWTYLDLSSIPWVPIRNLSSFSIELMSETLSTCVYMRGGAISPPGKWITIRLLYWSCLGKVDTVQVTQTWGRDATTDHTSKDNFINNCQSAQAKRSTSSAFVSNLNLRRLGNFELVNMSSLLYRQGIKNISNRTCLSGRLTNVPTQEEAIVTCHMNVFDTLTWRCKM